MRRISYKNYSKINELKKMNKIDDQFVFYIETLTLEDILSVKIESMMRNLNFKFYSFPLWHSMHKIISEALINSVFNLSKNNSEAARILGIDLKQYRKYVSEFGYEIKTWEK